MAKDYSDLPNISISQACGELRGMIEKNLGQKYTINDAVEMSSYSNMYDDMPLFDDMFKVTKAASIVMFMCSVDPMIGDYEILKLSQSIVSALSFKSIDKNRDLILGTYQLIAALFSEVDDLNDVPGMFGDKLVVMLCAMDMLSRGDIDSREYEYPKFVSFVNAVMNAYKKLNSIDKSKTTSEIATLAMCLKEMIDHVRLESIVYIKSVIDTSGDGTISNTSLCKFANLFEQIKDEINDIDQRSDQAVISLALASFVTGFGTKHDKLRFAMAINNMPMMFAEAVKNILKAGSIDNIDIAELIELMMRMKSFLESGRL